MSYSGVVIRVGKNIADQNVSLSRCSVQAFINFCLTRPAHRPLQCSDYPKIRSEAFSPSACRRDWRTVREQFFLISSGTLRGCLSTDDDGSSSQLVLLSAADRVSLNTFHNRSGKVM